MRVNGHATLTYPCYLKDPSNDMIILADSLVASTNPGEMSKLYGVIIDIGSADENTFWIGKYITPAYKHFTILCDKDGYEINSQEQKLTKSEIKSKIKFKIVKLEAEIQKLKEQEKECEKTYSIDELMTTAPVGTYNAEDMIGSIVVIRAYGNQTAIYVNVNGTIEPVNVGVWKDSDLVLVEENSQYKLMKI